MFNVHPMGKKCFIKLGCTKQRRHSLDATAVFSITLYFYMSLSYHLLFLAIFGIYDI